MAQIIQAVFGYLGQGLALTVQQLLILLGPGLLLALLMHGFALLVQTRAATDFGHNFYIALTAPGTVVHELGHALFCLVFGHRITDMQLFKPDRNGTLGYVSHTYNPRSIYQTIGNFFIGTGPIWFGTAVIFVLARLMLPPAVFAPMQGMHLSYADFTSWAGLGAVCREVGSSAWGVLRSLFSSACLGEWTFYLFAYLTFCIGSHVTLSLPDLKGAALGLAALAGLLMVFNLLTLWIGDFSLKACQYAAEYYAVFYAVMLLALILNVAIAFAVFGIGAVVRQVAQRSGARRRT